MFMYYYYDWIIKLQSLEVMKMRECRYLGSTMGSTMGSTIQR